jgi:hypothetical protein
MPEKLLLVRILFGAEIARNQVSEQERATRSF